MMFRKPTRMDFVVLEAIFVSVFPLFTRGGDLRFLVRFLRSLIVLGFLWFLLFSHLRFLRSLFIVLGFLWFLLFGHLLIRF